MLFYSFLIVTLFFAACNGEKTAEKMAEEAIEKQTGEEADINIEDGETEVKTKDGKATLKTGASVDLPDDFPEDVYICDNPNIIQTVGAEGSYIVVYQTEMSSEDIANSYMTEMKKEGWKLEGESNQANQKIRAFKKDERSTGVIISKADHLTRVKLSTGKK